MNFYDDLVMQIQMNYSKYYPIYASGGTPYQLTDKKPLPYSEQIDRLVQEVKEADCVVVGGASGLSAAGGGDFYYEDNDSYRKYFRPFAEKYHFKGAFAGMMHPWETREEYWGYLATFLRTTQTAPVRHPYLDLDALLKGKDFFILTTNQDTQFVKLYPENKVAEIQGDHRFFQCAACCTDDTWDAVCPPLPRHPLFKFRGGRKIIGCRTERPCAYRVGAALSQVRRSHGHPHGCGSENDSGYRCPGTTPKLSENLPREETGGFGAGHWLAQSADQGPDDAPGGQRAKRHLCDHQSG